MANQNGKSTTEATLNNSEAVFFKYGKQIIIAIVVLIVIIGGFVAYKTLISDPQEQEASTELAKSQTLFNAQQYDQALKGFMKVQSDYGSTEAGNLANLYIALCYAHSTKPNWASAAQYAEKFSTSDDQIISPASQMALGDIYANNNQNDKAVESLKKAAQMADAQADENTNLSIAPLALRKAGIILESEGKKS